MTVSTLVSSVAYTGNGVSSVFTYPFYIIDAAHLQVFVNGALQPASAYTVNSVGNQTGGEVVLALPPGLGMQVDLRRVVPATQLVDYRPYDPFPAETHEQALDKLTMIAQGHGSALDNAIHAPLLEPVTGASLVLPPISARSNYLLGFDALGNVMMYPQPGPPGVGVTDHGALTGLADNDHPQYALSADLAGVYLPQAGGTLTGALHLPAVFPAAPTEAVTKAYVDTFTGSVITKNVVSNATGDAQGTVAAGWNAQANAAAITRASNELIYYRWKSTDTAVYRYIGGQQGPAGWATAASDWAASSGVAEAPQDGKLYGRSNAAWAEAMPRSGGAFTGKAQAPAGIAAPADLARTDEVQVIANTAVDSHEGLLDPHPQYLERGEAGMAIADALPSLGEGMQWYESDTGGLYLNYKNPDGTFSIVALGATGGDFVPTALKGQPNGVASLDANGKVPNSQLPVSGRNVIINGNFSVWQRGISFNPAVSQGVTADRWKTILAGTAVLTAARAFGVAPSYYSLQYNVVTPDVTMGAAEFTGFRTSIEGYNFAPLRSQPMVLSFWVQSSVVGSYGIAFANSGADRTFVSTYTINTANTWEFKTISIAPSPTTGTWDFTNGAGLFIDFGLSSGTDFHSPTMDAWFTSSGATPKAAPSQVNFVGTAGANFFITGVQLERGEQPTPFEQRTIQDELRLCQRYYEKTYNMDTVPGATGVVSTGEVWSISPASPFDVDLCWHFTTRKRATPTISAFNPQTGVQGQARMSSGASVATTTLSVGETHATVTASPGANVHVLAHFVASAEL